MCPGVFASVKTYGPSTAYSFTRIDPAQEIARLRHSITLLEAYVFPTHRSQSTVQRRTNDSNALITPKKENVEPSAEGKGAAPGMLGSQVQGGLYAGPTSAATHLLIVRDSPLSPPTLPNLASRTTTGETLTIPRVDTIVKSEQTTTSQEPSNTTGIFSLGCQAWMSSMVSSSTTLTTATGYTGTSTKSPSTPTGTASRKASLRIESL